ncbi:MAG: hypothetical protein ACFBZ8_13085 [Opitutales bacterium]
MQRFVAKGIVTPPKNPSPPDVEAFLKLAKSPPKAGPNTSVVQAILEERESGW